MTTLPVVGIRILIAPPDKDVQDVRYPDCGSFYTSDGGNTIPPNLVGYLGDDGWRCQRS